MNLMITLKDDYTHFREGAERFQRALGGQAEIVPIFAQMHEFVMRRLGVSAREFYTSPHLIVAGTLAVQEELEIDVPGYDYDVYNIEAEALGQRITFHDDHMPDVDRGQPLIQDEADLMAIRTPDFGHVGRFPLVIEMGQRFQELTGLAPPLQFTAPFSLAANLRGIEQLLMDIVLKPDFARRLFERLTEEVLAPWIRYQLERFPQATGVSGADATASLPIVNPAILRDWAAPYILRLRELCGPRVYVANWVGERHLKDPAPMLELKLQVCPHFLEGQDPDVAELGPELYQQVAAQHEVPLILGLGAAFMASATPQEVRQRARRYMKVGLKHRRFALYLCNLGATTPLENVRAAVAAARAHGRWK
jgi:uroporphyrinogen-III decarboxylase